MLEYLDENSSFLFKQREMLGLEPKLPHIYQEKYSKEMIDVYKNLFYYHNPISQDKIKTIYQILQKFHVLLEFFSTLYKIGLDIKLYLIGCSLRDLLLNKPIKDLDILLTITNQSVEEIFEKKEYKKYFLTLFSDDEKEKLQINNISNMSLFFYVVHKFVEKN